MYLLDPETKNSLQRTNFTECMKAKLFTSVLCKYWMYIRQDDLHKRKMSMSLQSKKDTRTVKLFKLPNNCSFVVQEVLGSVNKYYTTRKH